MAVISNITGNYWLSYAGVPFCLDDGIQPHFREDSPTNLERSRELPFERFQQEPNLIDQINRIIPLLHLQDISLPPGYPGRNLGAMASPCQYGPDYTGTGILRIGDWYYPTTASRWSVFRGLAGSAQTKEMLRITQGRRPEEFVMRSIPIGGGSRVDHYTLRTEMYMLPPRPLAEHGASFDGLYLITLVDERYYWQYNPVSLGPNVLSTWAGYIEELAGILNVPIAFEPISTLYAKPEPDSQLWTNMESAAFLLDAIAFNVGRTLVRKMDGSYRLMTSEISKVFVEENRGGSPPDLPLGGGGTFFSLGEPTRTAGGDIFQGPGTRLAITDLTQAKNAVLPVAINVTFPKYVQGNDPVPHFANPKYTYARPQRPSCWYEESYGDTFIERVPLLSGGEQFSGLVGMVNPSSGLSLAASGFPLSGLVCSGYAHTIHTTAKALYSGDVQLALNPVNVSGLRSLAMKMAQDYWDGQVEAGLDEVYPGTYYWSPEGYHDIVWSYSATARQASTRVMRVQWNQLIHESQHSAHALSGYTNIPVGVGGPSVAQSWRDSFSGEIKTTLAQTMLSGDFVAVLASLNYLPTDQRWRGIINSGGPAQEIVLFEATSGMSGGVVSIVYRGIDGSIQQQHDNGSVVSQLLPNTAYGINLVNQGLMQWMFPSQWTSGGVQGVNIIPQTQSVLVLSNSGHVFNNRTHLSGRIKSYDTAQAAFVSESLCWIVERNNRAVVDGRHYDGQFAGYSANVSSGFVLSGFVPGLGIAPVYLIDVGDGAGMNFGSGCFRFLDDVAVNVTCISGEITTTVTKTYRYYYIQSGQSSNVPCESGG